jgi:hypothetical protein
MQADAINEAERIAEQQKSAGASQIESVAKAVHGAATELRDQMPQAAELGHDAASRLELGASALRERSIQDLLNGLNGFGRKDPLALFGGAAVAAFAISRFLKSSADHSR